MTRHIQSAERASRPGFVGPGREWLCGTYLAIGFGSLITLVMALKTTGDIDYLGWAIIMCAGVGLLGVFKGGPLLTVMLVVTSVFSRDAFRQGGVHNFPMIGIGIRDPILTGSLLICVLVQYRMIGLTKHLSPTLPRQREDPLRGVTASRPAAARRPTYHPRRYARGAHVEVLGMVLGAVAALLGAFFVLSLLPGTENPLYVENSLRPLWRLIALTWILGTGLFITTSLIRAVWYRTMSREEADLILQDMVWGEMRAEQTELDQWLAWADLRCRRKDIP